MPTLLYLVIGYLTCLQSLALSSLHNLFTDTEKMILLGSSKPDFSHIEIIESPTVKFYKKNKTADNRRRDKLLLQLHSLGERFTLDLKRNPSLSTALPIKKKSCFYHGKSRQHQDSVAAISLCDGVRGYIHTSDASYTIHPLPDNIVQRIQ
ncbi:Zinc metalloproteinase/disintegrin, partial [Stegodyphus mimosarum]